MVCTLGNDFKMFKTQVEPQATDQWFHCNVLNIIFDIISMANKSTEYGKLMSICYLLQYRQFQRQFLLNFHENRACEKEKK